MNFLKTGAFLFFLLLQGPANSQDQAYYFRGTIIDGDTRKPLAGANIVATDLNPPSGVLSGDDGSFSLRLPIGRHSIRISYVGYEEITINNVLIASGKELNIDISLREKVITTGDAVVKAGRKAGNSINPMATVSTNTIRTDDALRYAGGFYDPSRIVNAFAGVVTANSDQSNDIVIRGNSSRGLLWRIEGIESPNPNHFGDGQGGSGGAFSAITSNVIDNFDFFTGAFPAEFGNAFSGVMDLNLRKGNTGKNEFAFQTGMIGAEVSAEGPLPGLKKASYIVDARYTNFGYLAKLGIIDLGSVNIAPATRDITFNINMPTQKAGIFSVFGMTGASLLGTQAERDTLKWISPSDNQEEEEKQGSSVAGVKHTYVLPGNKSYTRLVLAFTSFRAENNEGFLDRSYDKHYTYTASFRYPSLRSSFIFNHKFSSRNTLRAGFNYSYLEARMSDYRINSAGTYDTLVLPFADGNMIQGYFQWKHRTAGSVEFNTGLHYLTYSLTGASSLEPRVSFRWNINPVSSFNAGIGFHSRAESMSVYSSLVKNTKGERDSFNESLGLSRAFHAVTGFDIGLKNDIRLKIEGYMQFLYNIPVVNLITSQYSTLNSAERLPDNQLENVGTGRNTGVETTLEKAFTRNYYFLVTASLFNSTYVAGDQRRYNTYYNTRYVTNILCGKDFYVGKNKRNTIGVNGKFLMRGGYRYTPVDLKRSAKYNRLLYNTTSTYVSQLPPFIRLDAGISFRKNNPRYSWIIMLDVQNVTDRHNIFRRRFSWQSRSLVVKEDVSIGIVPVFNLRVEF